MIVTILLEEAEGFEPSDPLLGHHLSRVTVSTAHARFHRSSELFCQVVLFQPQQLDRRVSDVAGLLFAALGLVEELLDFRSSFAKTLAISRIFRSEDVVFEAHETHGGREGIRTPGNL